MRFHGLDLNLLVALDALLVEGNVTRAAKRVHLSQPAMSAALARLREAFGDQLLVPVGRRLVRTPLADALEPQLREILIRIDSSLAMGPLFDAPSSTRSFRLAASDYMIAVLMERLVARIAAEAPRVSIELVPPDGGVELLERGELDLLLLPKQFALAEHPSDVTLEDSYCCVVWSGNKAVGKSLSLKQYLAAGHVATSLAGMPTFEQLFMPRVGAKRRIEVRTYNLTSPPRLIVGTQRIATVHTRLARQVAKTLPLRILPPPMEFPKFVGVMQWHRHKSQDPGLAWLRRQVHDTVADELD